MLSSVGARSSHPNLSLIPVGGFLLLLFTLLSKIGFGISLASDGSEGLLILSIYVQCR